MLGNILAAALGNLARNRLYAAISIASLAIGMAAALLTFLFVRDELTFDSFIPGHERIFVVVTHNMGPHPSSHSATPAPLAQWMRLDFPHIQAVTRYEAESLGVTHGASEIQDAVDWVDPNFFEVFRFKVLAGDLGSATRGTDGLVLTRGAARKYFGVDAPIGQTLQFKRATLFRVAAVIDDPPSNANITGHIFAPGRAATSPLAKADAETYTRGTYLAAVRTYVALADPRSAPAIDAQFRSFIRRHMEPPGQVENPDWASLGLGLTPIGAMHLFADNVAEVPPGNLALIYALSAVAVLVLVAAGLSFVNLTTARAARRGVEIGVRKVGGGGRTDIIAQFLGESLIYAALAAILAVALAELLLPGLNALLLRHIPFAYWRDPSLAGLIVGLVLVMGALAGLYPALILSSFRPSVVLKPGANVAAGTLVVRQALVMLQFAVLIGLFLAVQIILQQTRFALDKGTGLDMDQVVQVSGVQCRTPFVDAVGRMPGVSGMACSNLLALGRGDISTASYLPDGRKIPLNLAPVDFGFFEFYGLHPLAGRFPARGRGDDGVPSQGLTSSPIGPSALLPRYAVVNQAMVRRMRLASPSRAVGVTIRVDETTRGKLIVPVTIMGVTPDYVYDLTRGPAKPTIYPVVPDEANWLSIRLAAGQIPQTLTAIDAAWKQLGPPRPIVRRFANDYIDTLYAGVIRQGALIGALAAIATFIAALGLFGLAAFTAEQRTKEIGVRKVMGASTAEVVRRLLWQFVQPVLWANLIAWPVGWWAMTWWLRGFSAHIPLSPWVFLAAGGAALAIAASTVIAHALRIAAAKPVGALRYE